MKSHRPLKIGLALAAILLFAGTLIVCRGGKDGAARRVEAVVRDEGRPGEVVLQGGARSVSAPILGGDAPGPGIRPEQTPQEFLEYMVRDLATGEAAVGVPFELTAKPGMSSALSSDTSGRVSVPQDPEVRLSTTGGSWRGTWATGEPLPADRALWVYGFRAIRGRVLVAEPAKGALDTSTVRLQFCMVGVPAGKPGGMGPDPWNARWASAHGLWDQPMGSGVAADGGYESVVPHVRGAVVRAVAPGWMPGWTDIPESETEPIDVSDIILRRAIRVEGRITDERGVPLQGVRVSAFLTQRDSIDAAPLDVSRTRLVGWDVTAAGNAQGSTASYSLDVRSDSQGKFSFEYATHGELLLVAQTSGRETVRRNLGHLRADPIVQEVQMSRSDVPPLQFHRRGQPLAGWKCIIADLMDDPTGMQPQPSTTQKLSSEGLAPGTLMETGRDYFVILLSPDKREHLQLRMEDWGGNRTVDVADYGY